MCGQHISSELISRIQGAIDSDPALSRRALSRRLCAWLNWRSPNGKLQEMGGRKMLLELDRRGVVCLPECSTPYAFQQPTATAGSLPELAEVSCDLGELGDVEVVPVSSRYSQASRVWKALMETFHPLGAGPLCGAQIRYVVRSGKHGWLGGLSFSASTWRLQARDTWIGWSEASRRENLQQVVGNSRFLILPTVRVPHLASHVLSQCLKRLQLDWQERYGYAPVLVETFVDGEQYSGASYRAANWTHLGQTAARSNPYPNGKISSGPKQVYVYPLCPDCREILCREPVIPLGSRPAPEAPSDWAQQEFGRVAFYDARLKARLHRVALDFFAQPGALVPQACNGLEANVKGAYRFFANKQVNMQVLLRPHIEATVDRIAEHPVVLAVQDSSSLNYTAHAAADMGPIHTTQSQATGLILHDTLAFDTSGVPLGLLNVQCWARDKENRGKSARRKELPIEEKESIKWLHSYEAVAEAQALCPNTTLVSVGDREADLYELFDQATQNPSGPRLLVRAERSRNRRVEQQPLWDRLAKEPVAGHQKICVPRKGSRPKRTASLRVHHAKVKLRPPQHKDLPPVQIWAVYAVEDDPGRKVSSPLEWMLLTTAPVASLEDACQRLRWYALRWGIEVYHRTLKSGCRIEDRRLEEADRIEACLAIDMVVAWRVYLLTKQGRETPDIPCDVFLSEDEWQALYACVKRENPPTTPPPLRETVRMIAQLGGFLGRKCDGEPGTTTLWRGLQRLADITFGWVLARTPRLTRAGP